ncbi:hypothetical protein D3C73_1045650 [compost metagenome]
MVAHQFHGEEQALAAHVADDRVPGGQRLQALLHVSADVLRVFQQLLLLDHVQHRHADRRRHGRATEGVEVHRMATEGFDQGLVGDQAGQWIAVTHGFAEGDDVRHHAVGLMTPQVITGTAEAGLHFVGDEQTAGGADQRSGLVDETGRHPWQAFVGEQGVDQQRGRANALGLHRGNRGGDVGRVLLGQLRLGGAGRCPVKARNRHGAGMGGEGFRRGQGGGDLRQRRRVAVVVVVTDDDPGAATGKACQT